MKTRGIALVSVLFMLVGLLTLSATLFFSLFLDLQASSNVSGGDDALYAAEAGIHHLWSILEPATDFARELAWPGGEPPFGSPVGFPQAPRTYRVNVTGLRNGGLQVISEGTSHRGTRRKVQATFVREPAFRPPAALMLDATASPLEISGALDVSSGDGEVPLVGAESRPAAEAFRRARGDGAEVAIVGPTGLGDAVARVRPLADVTLDGPQSGGTFGSAVAPVIVRLTGAVEISGTMSVTGILLADSPLSVIGRLEVAGLLLAPFAIDIGGELSTSGAAWVASDFRLTSGGSWVIDYSTPALDQSQAAAHGSLPRAAILGAWREVW